MQETFIGSEISIFHSQVTIVEKGNFRGVLLYSSNANIKKSQEGKS